jgi:hypothetical protein
MRILLVEDHADTADRIAALLQKAQPGIEVFHLARWLRASRSRASSRLRYRGRRCRSRSFARRQSAQGAIDARAASASQFQSIESNRD